MVLMRLGNLRTICTGKGRKLLSSQTGDRRSWWSMQ